MSLVFSAITPNSPLLLEEVAEEESEQLIKTRLAIKELEQKLYLSKPETIIIIYKHDGLCKDKFCFNIEPKLKSDFSDFGNISISETWQCDNILASEIELTLTKLPFQLISKERLRKDISVPLHFLTFNMENIKILPIGVCELAKKPHLELGQQLKKVIADQTRRVAIIASGGLSHSLSDESPAGFHKDGAVFDNQIKKFLEQGDRKSIKRMDEATIENANEYLYNPLLVMLGVLSNQTFTYQEISYQQSFGIGHLVANLELP